MQRPLRPRLRLSAAQARSPTAATAAAVRSQRPQRLVRRQQRRLAKPAMELLACVAARRHVPMQHSPPARVAPAARWTLTCALCNAPALCTLLLRTVSEGWGWGTEDGGWLHRQEEEGGWLGEDGMKCMPRGSEGVYKGGASIETGGQPQQRGEAGEGLTGHKRGRVRRVDGMGVQSARQGGRLSACAATVSLPACVHSWRNSATCVRPPVLPPPPLAAPPGMTASGSTRGARCACCACCCCACCGGACGRAGAACCCIAG